MALVLATYVIAVHRASGIGNVGPTRRAFADRCGFAYSYMGRLKREKVDPSLDAIEKLAIAFDVDVVVLFATQVEATK